jgi:S1-C subfamily serine protease
MRVSFMVFAAVALLAGSAIGHAVSGPTRVGAVAVSVESRGLRAATGFVVADGRVVTVAHAVGAGPVEVGGRDATVVRRDEELDLALLGVPGVELSGAPVLGGPRVVVRRDGAGATVPAEILRRIDAHVRHAATNVVLDRPALELSAAIGAGDSGAPVIGADGRVAGVIFARSRDRAGIAYAVDATALADFLR